MNEELKHCPFCGTKAAFLTGGEHLVQICCPKCGATLPACFGENKKSDAIKAWNKRTFNPKYGKWILYEDEDTNAWECSNCHSVQQLLDGTPFENHWHYCPSCGAKMKTVNEILAGAGFQHKIANKWNSLIIEEMRKVA